MWYAIAFIAILVVASFFLTPKAKLENARAANLSDFNFPKADEGDPTPYVSGTVKIKSANTIWTGNFRTSAITKKVKTGMFSSKKQTTGYRYYFSFDMAICLGPDVVLTKIWFGKYLAWEGNISTETRFLIDKGDLYGGDDRGGGVSGYVTFYPGGFSQTQDPHLVASVNNQVPRYNGICHAVFENFYVGNSPSIQPVYFEVQRITNGLGIPDGKHVMAGGLDVNPMETFYDILCVNWGAMQLDTAKVDSSALLANAQTLYDEGNGISVYLAKANAGSDFISEIIRQINGVSYSKSTDGKITIKLIRKDYSVGELLHLDPTNVREAADISKTLWSETINQVRVTYPNRDNDYNDANAIEQDFANINFQQRVRNTNMSFPLCYTSENAQKLAATQRAHLSVPWFSMKITGNRELMQLNPGDPFVFDWPKYNISLMVMRAGAMDAGELENGEVSFTAIQDEFGGEIPAFGAGNPTNWTPPNYDPQKILVHGLFEAPYYLAAYSYETFDNTKTRYLAPARAPQSSSYSYKTIWSLDDFVTQYDGFTDEPYQGVAQLQTAYASTEGWNDGTDTVTGVVITNFDNGIGLVEATEDEARAGQNLIMINGEILSFETVTQNIDGTYTLGVVHRGLMDTIPATHLGGDTVYFLDGSIVGDDEFSPTLTLKSKFIDQAQLGAYSESLSDIVVLAFNQRPQRPLPPAYITFNGARGISPSVPQASDCVVEWRARNRFDQPIRFIGDSSDVKELGTTYTLRWNVDAGPWTTVTGITSETYTIPGVSIPDTGALAVEIMSVRSGLDSWTWAQAFATIVSAPAWDVTGTGIAWDVKGTGIAWKVI